MSNNILGNVAEHNNNSIDKIIYMLDNSIKVPQHILIEAIESQNNSKEKEEVLDKYISVYQKVDNLKNKIISWIFGNLDDESMDEICKDIIDIKDYEHIDIILNFIGIEDIELLKERAIKLAVNLGLNQDDIDDARSKAIEAQINLQEKVKLTDEYLANIVNDLKISDEIKSSSEEYVKHINKDRKPLLVVEYNRCIKYEYSPFFGDTTSQLEFDEECVYNVYLSRQSLPGILQTNSIDNSWIKTYQFDDNLTDYDMETIKSEVIVNLKPKEFDFKRLKNNDKWVTAKILKESFNIASKTKTETIDNIYKALGYGYKVIYGNKLYNKRLYRDAEKVYTQDLNKKIKYNNG